MSEKIKRCRKCNYVDKPPVKYRIYEEFLPEEVELLVISESPPPGEKPDYLYNLQNRDRLRTLLSKVLGVSQEEVPKFLKERGIFWTVAVKCRPQSKKELREMGKNCVEVLREEINELRPNRILALGKLAEKAILEIRPKVEVNFDRHPLYMARFELEGLKRLKKYLKGEGRISSSDSQRPCRLQ